MPGKDNHLKTAVKNRCVAISLLISETKSLAWSTTIAFYSALHLVEAALSIEGVHFEGHDVRNQYLKKTRKFESIWRHYKPLYDHSLKARYLMTDGDSAENFVCSYLGDDGVRKQIIGHHLRQIEKSVAKILDVAEIFQMDTPPVS